MRYSGRSELFLQYIGTSFILCLVRRTRDNFDRSVTLIGLFLPDSLIDVEELRVSMAPSPLGGGSARRTRFLVALCPILASPPCAIQLSLGESRGELGTSEPTLGSRLKL